MISGSYVESRSQTEYTRNLVSCPEPRTGLMPWAKNEVRWLISMFFCRFVIGEFQFFVIFSLWSRKSTGNSSLCRDPTVPCPRQSMRFSADSMVHRTSLRCVVLHFVSQHFSNVEWYVLSRVLEVPLWVFNKFDIVVLCSADIDISSGHFWVFYAEPSPVRVELFVSVSRLRGNYAFFVAAA